jgi:hypothetical protein
MTLSMDLVQLAIQVIKFQMECALLELILMMPFASRKMPTIPVYNAIPTIFFPMEHVSNQTLFAKELMQTDYVRAAIQGSHLKMELVLFRQLQR